MGRVDVGNCLGVQCLFFDGGLMSMVIVFISSIRLMVLENLWVFIMVMSILNCRVFIMLQEMLKKMQKIIRLLQLLVVEFVRFVRLLKNMEKLKRQMEQGCIFLSFVIKFVVGCVKILMKFSIVSRKVVLVLGMFRFLVQFIMNMGGMKSFSIMIEVVIVYSMKLWFWKMFRFSRCWEDCGGFEFGWVMVIRGFMSVVYMQQLSSRLFRMRKLFCQLQWFCSSCFSGFRVYRKMGLFVVVSLLVMGCCLLKQWFSMMSEGWKLSVKFNFGGKGMW